MVNGHSRGNFKAAGKRLSRLAFGPEPLPFRDFPRYDGTLRPVVRSNRLKPTEGSLGGVLSSLLQEEDTCPLPRSD
jgi:hypothetical protein